LLVSIATRELQYDAVMEIAERDILVPASPEETWEAVTDGERLAEWLAGDPAEVDLRPGGELRITVDDEQRVGFFEEVDAPRRVVFWWSRDDDEAEASRVEIELEPERDQTRVRVTETRPLAILDARGLEVELLESRLRGGAEPQMRAAALASAG
jgi:uncharacterized protein YndB with AHSA1/START domain